MGKEEPGKAEIEQLPEEMSFNSALVTDSLLRRKKQGTIIGSERALFGGKESFADVGEAVFSQGELDEKEDTAEGVRGSLVELMKKENLASMDAAQKIQGEHRIHKNTKLDPAIAVAKQKYMEAYIALAKYMEAYSGIGVEQADRAEKIMTQIRSILGAGKARELVPYYSKICANMAHEKNPIKKGLYKAKSSILEGSYNRAINTAEEKGKAVPAEANKWNERLKKYHDEDYKKIARNYDDLFEDYYVLARGVQHRGAPFAAGMGAAKEIAEYTGVYSADEIGSFPTDVANDPIKNFNIQIVPGKTVKQGSHNVMRDQVTKIHTMVTMEAFGLDDRGNETIDSRSMEANAGRPPRIRIKVDSGFRGYTGRHQYDEQGQIYDITAPNPGQGANLSAGMWHMPDKANPRDVDGLRLRVNERGKNGEYLYSQRSAHIYSIRQKKGKGTRKAMFVGSRLVPADARLLADDEAKKWDMSSESNIARREKLRTAIRSSDYFHHINAATINYYMHYDGDKGTMAVQNVDRSFMAKRAGFFDKTTLKQNWFDGTYQQLAGGILTMGFDGATFEALAGKDEAKKAEAKALGVYKSFGDVVTSSLDLHGQIKDKEDAATFGAVYASLAAVPTVATAVFDSANIATGGIFTSFFGALVSMGKSVSDIIDAVNSFKKRNNSAEGADAVYKVLQKIADFLGTAIGFVNSTLGAMGVVTGALGDVVGGIGILRDGLSLMRNAVEGFLSARQLYRIDRYDRELRTAMETPNDTRGEAVSKNSQVRLALTQNRRKETIALTGNVANGLADIASGAGTVSGTWSPIGAPLKLVSKALKFVGMGIQKGMKIGYQVSDIATFLGDKSLFTVNGFDEVLKEETGINNKHYLPDLTKIFMAIDTHVMINYGQSQDEKELGKEVSKLILRGDDPSEASSYNRILKALGAPNDWRSVMLESIADEGDGGVRANVPAANAQPLAAGRNTSAITLASTTLSSTTSSEGAEVPMRVEEVAEDDDIHDPGAGSTTGPGAEGRLEEAAIEEESIDDILASQISSDIYDDEMEEEELTTRSHRRFHRIRR